MLEAAYFPFDDCMVAVTMQTEAIKFKACSKSYKGDTMARSRFADTQRPVGTRKLSMSRNCTLDMLCLFYRKKSRSGFEEIGASRAI